jgi:hypothetical protein
MAYVTAEPCSETKDTACVDACPVDCIHPKKNTSYEDGHPSLDEVSCRSTLTSSRASIAATCVPVCVVSAIFAMDDLPEKWKQYADINASYVPGGKFTPDEYAKHAPK